VSIEDSPPGWPSEMSELIVESPGKTSRQKRRTPPQWRQRRVAAASIVVSGAVRANPWASSMRALTSSRGTDELEERNP
jgi:hypothetical protein